MAKPTYDKPPVTISDQLDILDEKGMTIADMAFARHALETIGYFVLQVMPTLSVIKQTTAVIWKVQHSSKS